MKFILILVFAAGSLFAEKIGEVKTKGMFIKDSLEIHVFDDPTIKGIACYTTKQIRPMSFEDSSSTSIACRQVGPISGKLVDMPNVFTVKKNPLFKKMVVDRFYDAKRKVLIYLTYTKAMSGDNSSHSISVVVLK